MAVVNPGSGKSRHYGLRFALRGPVHGLLPGSVHVAHGQNPPDTRAHAPSGPSAHRGSHLRQTRPAKGKTRQAHAPRVAAGLRPPAHGKAHGFRSARPAGIHAVAPALPQRALRGHPGAAPGTGRRRTELNLPPFPGSGSRFNGQNTGKRHIQIPEPAGLRQQSAVIRRPHPCGQRCGNRPVVHLLTPPFRQERLRSQSAGNNILFINQGEMNLPGIFRACKKNPRRRPPFNLDLPPGTATLTRL